MAREDRRVDQTSGVSQRLPISLLELVASSTEQRALLGRERAVARPLDVYRGIPAVTGKVELEYEGELEGAARVARDLVTQAFGLAFGHLAGDLKVDPIVAWFDEGNLLKLPENSSTGVLEAAREVPGLLLAARQIAGRDTPEWLASAAEFVLEGLAGRKKITRGEESYTAAQHASRSQEN